jgi:hypothetical protein
MGDISDHFSRWEFACRCGCGFDTADIELVEVLEDLYENFEIIYKKIKIKITGPNRCWEHNEDEGGEDDSKHLLAQAADIKVFCATTNFLVQIDPELIWSYLDIKYNTKYGIGRYRNRTHIDIRKDKARWDKR